MLSLRRPTPQGCLAAARCAALLFLVACAHDPLGLEGLALSGEVQLNDLHVADDGARLQLTWAVGAWRYAVLLGLLGVGCAGAAGGLLLLALDRGRALYLLVSLAGAILLAAVPASAVERAAVIDRGAGTIHIETQRLLGLYTSEVALDAAEVRSMRLLFSESETHALHVIEVVDGDGQARWLTCFITGVADLPLAEALLERAADAAGGPAVLPAERRWWLID